MAVWLGSFLDDVLIAVAKPGSDGPAVVLTQAWQNHRVMDVARPTPRAVILAGRANKARAPRVDSMIVHGRSPTSVRGGLRRSVEERMPSGDGQMIRRDPTSERSRRSSAEPGLRIQTSGVFAMPLDRQ